MDTRDHARYALQFSRRILNGQLETFKTPETWVFQVHPKANHALWIAAHLALVDNSFINKFRPALARKPEGWDTLFGFGSQPKPDANEYPPPDEVLAYFHERRSTLLRLLDELSVEEWEAPAPPTGARSPLAGAPNMGHSFIFVSQHEAMHAGQLTVAHRALGHAPLLG
jgi:uncharacterized damage-inducible protein DinB